MSEAPRVVLVTGAASGMGLVTSRRFLDRGDRVVAWDLDADGLRRAWAGAGPERVLTAAVDVADPEATDAGIEQVLARFGAWTWSSTMPPSTAPAGPYLCLALPPERWRRLVDVNLLGAVNVARSAADALSAAAGVLIEHF